MKTFKRILTENFSHITESTNILSAKQVATIEKSFDVDSNTPTKAVIEIDMGGGSDYIVLTKKVQE